MRWWTGHHGTPRAGRHDVSDSWGDPNTGYSSTIALEVAQWRPPVDRKEWAAPAEISRYRRKIAARFLEKSSTTTRFRACPLQNSMIVGAQGCAPVLLSPIMATR